MQFKKWLATAVTEGKGKPLSLQLPRQQTMANTIKTRPLVPSGSSNLGYGGGSSRRAGGAKNHWVNSVGHYKIPDSGNERIATWNIRTMQRDGKMENIQQEMKTNKINILGLCETRWKGSGDYNDNGYRIIYSGGKKHQNGVALILDRHHSERVIKTIKKNDRMMLTVIEAEPANIAIIQVYMPTTQHDDDEIEEMYEQIEELIQETKRNDYLILMGDWNAIVGEGRDGQETGAFGLGSRNPRGQQFVDFCKQHQMTITNTLFEQNYRRRYTWKSPGDRMRCQIDYIAVRQRYRNSVKKSCSYPGADADTDHNLVMMTTNLKLKKVKRRKPKKRWNLEKLKNQEIARNYATQVEQQLDNVGQDCINGKWNKVKDVIKEAAEVNIGYIDKIAPKKPWINDEMISKMRERRKWKAINTEIGRKNYKKLNNELRRETQRARDTWWQEICHNIQDLEKRGQTDLMYHRIKEVTGEKKTQEKGTAIKDHNGSLLTDKMNIRGRWKTYIEDLYNKPNKPTQEELQLEKEEEIEEDFKGPSILQSEVEEAIRHMKKKKSEGIDNIPAELLKSLNSTTIKILTDICNDMYNQGKWPEDFYKTIMIPLKKKLNATECSDHRTISLIPHASKIMLRILTRRLETKASNYIGKSQFGFKRGCGTREAIGVMRTLIERSLEYDNQLYICYIDFEKAFDRVNWKTLMETLRRLGIDWKDRRLIQDLYINQIATIRIDNEESNPAIIGQGVRQGCLLSPLLFLIYTERMMIEALDNVDEGMVIGGETIKEVRFADDQAMVANTERGLQKLINSLNLKAKDFNMKINVKKTKAMRISRSGEETINITLDNQQVEQVKSFKYLGAIITSNGRCNEEIRTRIAMAKTAFMKRRELLTKALHIETKKKIVKTIIWSVALYGSETWTLQEKDKKRIEALETWIWRRMQCISWQDKKTNEEVFEAINEKRSILNTIIRRKKNWIGHILRGESMVKTIIEGRFLGKRGRGKPRKGMLDEFKSSSYRILKDMTSKREEWRMWMP